MDEFVLGDGMSRFVLCDFWAISVYFDKASYGPIDGRVLIRNQRPGK